MRIGVVGNCQARGIADCLAARLPGADIEAIAHLDISDPAMPADTVARLKTCDRVMIQSLLYSQPRFGQLIAALEQASIARDRIRVWPAAIFRGFHPDSIHLWRPEGLVPGPVGNFHSALLCAGWIEGVPEGRMPALFNAFIYADLGYFDAFDADAALLTERAEGLGFDLSAFTRYGSPCFMHTLNHPAIFILDAIVTQTLTGWGVGFMDAAPVDRLADGARWPLYPEIVARRGLNPRDMAEGTALDAVTLTSAAYQSLRTDQTRHGPLDPDNLGTAGQIAVDRARRCLKGRLVR